MEDRDREGAVLCTGSPAHRSLTFAALVSVAGVTGASRASSGIGSDPPWPPLPKGGSLLGTPAEAGS